MRTIFTAVLGFFLSIYNIEVRAQHEALAVVQGAKQHLMVTPNVLHRLGRNDGSGINRGSRHREDAGSGEPSEYDDDIELWLDTIYIEGDGANNRVGESFYVQFGADHTIGKNLIVGIIGGYDDSSFNDVDIDGWLANTYVVGSVPSYNLHVEGNFGFGESEVARNRVSFATKRVVFSSAVSSDFEYENSSGRGYIFTPRLRYSYFSDDADVRLGSQSQLELNQVATSLSASTDIEFGDSVFTPSLSFTASYDSSSGISEEDTASGTLGGSLYIYGRNGVNWHIGGHYDVFNDSTDLQTYGIKSGLNVRF